MMGSAVWTLNNVRIQRKSVPFIEIGFIQIPSFFSPIFVCMKEKECYQEQNDTL